MFSTTLWRCCIALGAACVGLHAQAAVNNGTYLITSNVSGKPVEVSGASTANAANIMQWSDNGRYHQHWVVTNRGNGFYSVTNRFTGKAMEVYNWSTADGGNVAQYEYWGGDSQLWSITEHGDGVVSFINKFSGKALDLYNFDTSDGANIAQWTYYGNDAQRFLLTPINSSNVPVDTSTTNGAVNHWPLSGNLGTHDPTAIYENGTWYEMQTGPGIYGKYSTDGFFWHPLPPVFPDGLSWWKTYVPNQEGIDVWAPDLKYFNGRVWLYYSISTFGSRESAIGLASATSMAEGSWRDDGLVIRTTSANNYNAIDPDLVIDKNGNPWLTFGSWNSGIKLVRLNPNTMKPSGMLHSIASRGGGIEAPTIIYRQGYYYLFTSIGKCCAGTDSTYQIMYGRSANIAGPYVDKNGVSLMQGGGSILDAGNSQWVGPGGQDIVNTDVIVRHAYDASDNGAAKLLISTLNWDAAGWPRY